MTLASTPPISFEKAKREKEREQERILVALAIEKDGEAFAELYDMHLVRVYRHIFYLVNDAGQAEDLTAQTFLKAWESVGRYKERGAPFVSWLLRIAHNLTVSHLRAKRVHVELEDVYVDHKQDRNPEDALQHRLEESSVRRAVIQLSSPYLDVKL